MWTENTKELDRQLNPGLLRKPAASFPVVLGDFGCDVTWQVFFELKITVEYKH